MNNIAFAPNYYFYFSFTGFYGKAYCGLAANARSAVQ